MTYTHANIARKILIINGFFVSLQKECRVFALVLAGLLVLVECHAQTTVSSPFNTIGEGYRKHRGAEVREIINDEPDEVIDPTEVIHPPADSLSAHLPMVALPLGRIVISSPFGFRKDPMKRGRIRMHSGMDLKARYETVFSMLPGKVVATSYSTAGGYYITVHHGFFVCSYLHLSRMLVREDDHVSAGQPIAISGNTGRNTTGPHLHISCRWGDTKGKYFDPTLILEYITTQLTNK